MLKSILNLGKQSKPKLIVLGTALVILLGVIDFATGSELGISLFYLLPISMVAWFVSRRMGIALSVLATAIWFGVNMRNRLAVLQPMVLIWNAALLLGFFLTLSLTLSALGEARRRQDELTHLIVHDLRSPLSISVMSLDVLDESFGDTLSAPQKELLAVCKMSYNQMMTLINSILDLARLESGQMPLRPRRLEIGPIIKATIQSLAIEAQQKNVRLVTDLSPEANTVFADPLITERILVNLLSNAIKFSPQDEIVTVRVEPTPPDLYGMAVFSIQDNGRGIPAEWIQRVFRPFEQVDTQPDRTRSGSGLGLAFCRLAVEAQGGYIGINSQLGQGTTITFTLPLAEQE